MRGNDRLPPCFRDSTPENTPKTPTPHRSNHTTPKHAVHVTTGQDVQKRQEVAYDHEPQWYLRCLEVVHDGYGARDAGEVTPECAPEVADALPSRHIEPQSQRQEDACIARHKCHEGQSG